MVCAQADEAIEFYKNAFGATELSRMPGPDGKIMYASLRIGDSVVMLSEEMPQWESFGPRGAQGHARHHPPLRRETPTPPSRKPSRAGAKAIMPLEDMFWGDRYGKVEDPAGHQWAIATHVREVSPEEMQKAMEQMFS